MYGRAEVHLHEFFQFQMEVGRQLHARAPHLRHTRQRRLQYEIGWILSPSVNMAANKKIPVPCVLANHKGD